MRLITATAAAATCATCIFLLRRKLLEELPVGEEQAVREDLAAAHTLSAHFGFDELVWNHISARRPGTDQMFITSGVEHFDEVTPDSLVISGSGNANITADVIHGAIYAARPDIGAIVHHHTCATTSVSVLKSGLKYLTQDAAAFYGKVAYHDWEGVSDDYDECKLIQQALGPTAHTLIMRNHGCITTGRTVAEAWVRYFYLERVCRIQIATLGQPLNEPDESVMKHAAEQLGAKSPFNHGNMEWPSLRRLAARLTKARKISERPF